MFQFVFWVCGITFLVGIVVVMAQSKAQSNRAEAVERAANDLRERMLSKFPQYARGDFIGGDTLAIILDEQNRKALVANANGIAKEVPFSAFKSVEIVTDGDTIHETRRKGGVTRAVAGGLLLGGAGAIVGALTARSEHSETETIRSISVTATTDDPHYPTMTWSVFKPHGMLSDLTPHEAVPFLHDAAMFHNRFSPIFEMRADEEVGLIAI